MRYVDLTIEQKREYHTKKSEEWRKRSPENVESNLLLQKKWRLENRRYWQNRIEENEEERKKVNTRQIFNRLKNKKNIKNKKCIICGVVGEAHHPDYNYPLKVIWLCRKHHRELHKKMYVKKNQISN